MPTPLAIPPAPAKSEPATPSCEVPDSGRLAYRLPEAARAVGVSESLFKDWVADGKVPYIAISKRTKLFPRQQLEAWLAAQCRVPTAPLGSDDA